MNERTITVISIYFLIAGMLTLSFFAGLWKGETIGLREQDSAVIIQLRSNVNNRGQFILWAAQRDSTGVVMVKAKELNFLR